jgi:tripartite-type tricarboxylate transporter receptor subunit TctC
MGLHGLVIRRLTIAGAFGVAAALASTAGAQSFPNRAITIIVNSPAGSVMEGNFRAIGAEASKLLGQPVVMENRPGANGRLGLMAIKSAPADGHLLTIAHDAVLVSQPSADPTFQLEQGRDYLPVAFLIEFPLVLAGSPTLPFRDIRGLLAYAKANPGKLNWATTAGNMFVTEMVRQSAGIEITTIPYKGASSAFLDIVAGRTDLVFAGSDVVSFFKAGKMIGIGTSGGQRWAVFPDLPTFTESGIPAASTVWYGLLAPPGTSPEVIAKVNDAFNSALKLPQVTKLLVTNGFVTGRFQSPKEFSTHIQSELGIWGPVIRKSGLKLE